MARSFREHIPLLVACLVWAAWAGAFIFRSSFVALDGQRYFALFDDAMISMRYAWNFAHGLGLVWNPGEHVEGYTNLLLVLLMALPSSFLSKSLAVLSIQIFGGMTLLGIAYLSRALTMELFVDLEPPPGPALGLLGFACGLAYYPLSYWALMGMETGLLALLLLFVTLKTVRYRRTRESADLLWLALGAGLAFLTRADSIVVSLPLMAIAFVIPWRERRPARFVRPALLFLTIVFGELAFRWFYYHALVPNTYVLKLEGIPIDVRLHDGVVFLLPFFRELLPVILACIATTALRFRREKLVLALTPVALVTYQILVGGEPWAYWRIVSPGVPLLLILIVVNTFEMIQDVSTRFASWIQSPTSFPSRLEWARLALPLRYRELLPSLAVGVGLAFVLLAVSADALGISDAGLGTEQKLLVGAGALLVLFGSSPSRRTMAVLGTALIFVALVAIVNRRFQGEITFSERPYSAADNGTHINIALALNEITTPDATIGVFWAGTIPYYTSLYTIDYLGKNDPYIAHLPPDLSGAISWLNGMITMPGHNKYDLDYSIKLHRPTYSQDFRWGHDELWAYADDNYVQVVHRGVRLYLLRDSDAVLWEEIRDP